MGKIKKMTQAQRVLRFMQRHKKGITALQAIKHCGCIDLAGRIRDLKEDGHIIGSEYVYVVNQFGEKVRVKQYTLKEQLNG